MARARHPRCGQRAAVVAVCLSVGLVAGFVAVAVVVVGSDASPGTSDAGVPADGGAPPTWRTIEVPGGGLRVDLPGRPVAGDDPTFVGAARGTAVAWERVELADGTMAVVADLGGEPRRPGDLRLLAAGMVLRAGGAVRRYEEVTSELGSAASFAGRGQLVTVRGYLLARGSRVTALVVTAPPAAATTADAALLRMVGSLRVG
jgi:hypothetical protein